MKPKLQPHEILRKHSFAIELQNDGRSHGWASAEPELGSSSDDDEPFAFTSYHFSESSDANDSSVHIDSPVSIDASGNWWPTLAESLTCCIFAERKADNSLANFAAFPCELAVPADAEMTRRGVQYTDDDGAELVYFNTDPSVAAVTPSPWLVREWLGTDTDVQLRVRLEVQGKRAAEKRAAARAAQAAREAGAADEEVLEAGRAAAEAAEDDGSGWLLEGLRIFLYWREHTSAEDCPVRAMDVCGILTGPKLEWV